MVPAVNRAQTNGNGKHEGAPLAASEIVPISPNDLRPLAPVRASTADEVRAAVTRARAAQQHWRLRPLGDRIGALKRAAKEMLRRRAEVIELSHAEMGKVACEGTFIEALGPLDAVGGWASVVSRAVQARTCG